MIEYTIQKARDTRTQEGLSLIDILVNLLL